MISDLFKKLYNWLIEQFYLDQKSWILWLVVFFCFGIISYFALSFEPNLVILAIITLIIFIVLFFCRTGKFVWVLLLMACLIAGMDCAKFRTFYIETPKLYQEYKSAQISGYLESVIPGINSAQFIIDKIYIAGISQLELPKKAKITIKGIKRINELQVGDYIKLKATLKPPSKPLVPGGYNFAMKSFFEQIGVTGFAVSNIYLIKKNQNRFLNYISNKRIDLSKRIKATIGERNGSIAAALIIGEQTAIDKEILSQMRASGLTHILSVSGLHLSMVSVICFFCIRFLLSCSVYLAQKYDTKKIAGYISLLMTLAYLLISGMQIAAVRSYIMVVCVIMAVLFDRQEYALRSVCFAAFVMLIFAPESIMHPSFQMSFVAVIALVSGYEYYLTKPLNNSITTNVGRIKKYFLGALIATFIAGLATAPFAIYHFNQYANYSMLANLIVAPVTSFIIMPAVVLSCLLFPLGLEKFGLYIMNYGIEFLVWVAGWVSNLPKAVIMLPNMDQILLMTFVIGLLWLCLWQQKWRVLGVIPVAIAIICLLYADRPDLMVDANSGTILIRSIDNNLVRTLNKSRLSQFSRDYFNAKMQTDYIVDFNQKKYLEEFNCLRGWCHIDYGYKIHFSIDQSIAVLPIYFESEGYTNALITADDLKKSGSYFITFAQGRPKIQSASSLLNSRPWN